MSYHMTMTKAESDGKSVSIKYFTIGAITLVTVVAMILGTLIYLDSKRADTERANTAEETNSQTSLKSMLGTCINAARDDYNQGLKAYPSAAETESGYTLDDTEAKALRERYDTLTSDCYKLYGTN